GIVVSTLVNMFVLPPNYIKDIERNIKKIYLDIGKALDSILSPSIDMHSSLQQLNNRIDKTKELIQYQQEGSHFQPFAHHDQRGFSTLKKELEQLRLIHYHLNNIEN